MGRYSSVQAYADSNANARTVSYAQATGSKEVKGGAVKTEKVVNPFGSAAGAGSGEFHVYRHERAREMERIKDLEKSDEDRKMDQEFEEKFQRENDEEDQKTAKRRKKRQRQKEAKMRKKNLAQAGIAVDASAAADDDADGGDGDGDNGKGEFDYTPVYSGNGDRATDDDKTAGAAAGGGAAFPNDGSFLERMKRQLEEDQNKEKGAQTASTNPESQEKGEADSPEQDEPPKKKQAT